ncbi:hypothetical protein WA04_08880 [Streptococcus agalactiae]|uniref:Uncharacterized protein n=1 Tax=Streptococcus agalactiae TaxID=1311 RepID=A0A837KX68_STRAG|nr:hypothetical protein [Streptococcus agalactiae]KLL36516.1 hypothetical protein WA04_08880 [Streptococcus agalactiae]
MSKQLMIRNLSDDTFLQLKSLSKQLGYDSFNQFILSQLELIASNNGLTLYDNAFAEELITIKSNQKQLLENQHQIQINQVVLLAKQKEVGELLETWLQFMDEVDAIHQRDML